MGGWVVEKIKLPKLVWYILLGLLISPSVLNVVDDTLLSIASYLRQIALVIILTRAGLSLDIATLKKIGRPAILMCFIPATFEIVGVAIFAPLFLQISQIEALLLGAVLAAVSPAIVVPRMIKLMEERYGEQHHVPELIMAGASCDDIFVIILFYSFKNLVATSTIDAWSLSQIPISIFTGVLLGALVGILMRWIVKRAKLNTIVVVVLLLGVSFGILAVERLLQPYVSVSSLLAIIVTAVVVNTAKTEQVREIKKSYHSLWQGFEILLFVLVGVAVDAKYAFSSQGAIILGLILLALLFRSAGVLTCLIFTNFSWREKLFIVLSYLPKATVQASIGAIALSEGLACGTLVLTAAVVSILLTAPLGAILMDTTYKKLLPLKPIEKKPPF